MWKRPDPATETRRRARALERQRMGVALGAVLSVETAAELLGIPNADDWLRDHGLVAQVCGESRVIWSDVVDALRVQRRSPDEETRSEFMTTADVAEMFSVSPDMVARWRADDGLPHQRLGHRSIRYRRSEVLAWARQTTVASSKEQTHGLGQKEGRRLPRRLSLQMPADREIEEIPPHDWNPKQEGG